MEIIRIRRDMENFSATHMLKENMKEEHRRREMFEKVALAMTTWETPWSWQDCAKQTESLLEEADKFAKGE